MTEHRPPPLVPPEVSMGANDFFPFYFDRLRKSKWWRRASDTARARNVTMWGEAYKAQPAGSLENDDDELAEAAGYGMDVETFLTVKDEIMAPWVLCSDGRWYHPTVCDVVLETWERTSDKRKQSRARQQARRQRIREQTANAAPSESRVTDPTVTRDTGHVARESASQDKTGQDTNNTAAPAPPLTAVEGGRSEKKLAENEPWKLDPEFLTFWDACSRNGRRRSGCREAWKEWLKLRKRHSAADVMAALRIYLVEDPDVARTGGPGVHIWLKDRFPTWHEARQASAPEWTPERWALACQIWKEKGTWGESFGPAPGQPGCRVPQPILAQLGLGLRVVTGGQAA